jgi:hypothetical protein
VAESDSIDFIFVPPPVLLIPSAVNLTPPQESVLGIASTSANFNRERPKLFEVCPS